MDDPQISFTHAHCGGISGHSDKNSLHTRPETMCIHKFMYFSLVCNQ